MEFSGNFRITYNVYRAFAGEARKAQLTPLIICYIVLLLCSFFYSVVWFIALIFAIIFTEILYRVRVKRIYYENQKRYMENTVITVNSQGISEKSNTRTAFYSVNDILKIVEKKDCFFIFITKEVAICLEKRQFEDNQHISQFIAVLRQYYSHIPTKLLPNSYLDEFSFKEEISEKSYYIEPVVIDKASNKRSIIRLYIIVSLVVVVACISPVRHSEKNAVDESEAVEDYVDNTSVTIKEYIDLGNGLMDIQNTYKAEKEYMTELEDIYSRLEKYDSEISFYEENRAPEIVLLYHYTDLCYNLIYIMDKPYSQLNYMEKAEYDTVTSQINEYKQKLQGCVNNESGII